MLSSLAITLLLSCPVSMLNNDTDSWRADDQLAFESAKKRCVVHYEKSPCLIEFRKLKKLTYHAICGRKRK